MNLIRTGATAITWYLRVLRNLLRARAPQLLGLILANLVVRVTSTLAFMIPLKVLLLAGSDRVPRYMPFVDQEHRGTWIIALGVIAVLCYFVTLFLDKLIDDVSTTGGRSVLKAGNDLIVADTQRKQASITFARTAGITADILFVSVAATGVFLLEPFLLMWLAGLFVIAVLVSAVALAGWDVTSSNRLARFIIDERPSYIDIWGTIAFFSTSIVLLSLLYLGYTNLLLAIISFILTRRGLTSVESVVNGLSLLYQRRFAIESILYRSRSFLPQETGDAQTVRQLFSPDRRELLMREQLHEVVELDGDPVVEWLDPLTPQIDRFAVSAPLREGGRADFLVHVVSERGLHFVENEQLLFDHVARASLGAPELVKQFEVGDFTCLLFRLDSTADLSAEEDGRRLDLAMQRWVVQPPRQLVNAYRASHRMLPDFIDDAMLERLAFAAKNADELSVVERARELRDRIRDKLAAMPVVICNKRMSWDAARGDEDEIVAVNWGDWSLVPIGADMPARVNAKELENMLDVLRARRKDVPADLTPADLKFAYLCQRLNLTMVRRRFRLGLAEMRRLLEDPALHAGSPEDGGVSRHAPALAAAGA